MADAVVTMELQRGVVGDLASMRELADEVGRRGILGAAGRLVAGARDAGVPVVHCIVEQRPDGAGSVANTPLFAMLGRKGRQLVPGAPAAELVPELAVEESDIVERRRHGILPFGQTTLDATLRNLGVTTIVVAGVSVNLGIIGTCIEAVNHGYRALVATDAVAGIPADYAEAVLANSIAYVATLTTVDAVLAGWAAGT
ncbi:MAG TPA: cysteine hydrolase [Acidimicrobiales bacterium]